MLRLGKMNGVIFAEQLTQCKPFPVTSEGWGSAVWSLTEWPGSTQSRVGPLAAHHWPLRKDRVRLGGIGVGGHRYFLKGAELFHFSL